jgi:hypothetical protein
MSQRMPSAHSGQLQPDMRRRLAKRRLVLSRDAGGIDGPWNLTACRLNLKCKIPGNPFAAGFVLAPNPIEDAGASPADVSVTFGPWQPPQPFDRVTLLMTARGSRREQRQLEFRVEIIDAISDDVLSHETSSPRTGSEHAITLVCEPAAGGAAVRLRFGVRLNAPRRGGATSAVAIRYLMAYEGDELAELCNALGSDKGTERSAGQGVPHCYALLYARMFDYFREQPFNLLEIGLSTESPPRDAPSLRVWREYFPNAVIYGYDIEDFRFFTQDRTTTFQGDQASRDDLTHFLEMHGKPTFKLIIDDGSHASSHQQISLGALFPSVCDGGVYVIEDINWQPFPEAPTTREVLDQFIHDGGLTSPFLTDAETSYLASAIEKVEIFKPNDSDVAVIYKKSS